MPVPMTSPVNRITGWLRAHSVGALPHRAAITHHLRLEHGETYKAAHHAGFHNAVLVDVHDAMTGADGIDAPSCYDISQAFHDIAVLAGRQDNGPHTVTRLIRAVLAEGITDRYDLATRLFDCAESTQSRRFDGNYEWETSHNWYEEFVRYVEAGWVAQAACLVGSRVPFEAAAVHQPTLRADRDRHIHGPGIVAEERWLDMLRHAKWDLNQVLPLMPYLDEPGLADIPLATITAWQAKRGTDRTLLIARAGLDLTEGLTCTASDDSLRVLASLRSPA